MGKKRLLLITPEYPSQSNSSDNNFIHSHIKEYIKDENLEVEVACVNQENDKSLYEYEGIQVIRTVYEELRSILMSKKYDAILVYKLNKQYEKYLKTSYIKDTTIILIEDEENNYSIINKDIDNLTVMKLNEIENEIAYIKQQIKELSDIIRKVDKVADNPVLTVTIPSYNAENVLHKCLQSLLKTEYAYLTEILVINDGSKDETAQIGKIYEKLTTVDGKSIVKIINKKNGGHGSGINKGIELARGKYFRVIDADDWVDEKAYNQFLEKLIKEDVDLVLTDLSEARSFEENPTKREYYKNLEPEKVYEFDDICIGENGFEKWGPMLPTATYKLEKLRKANFKLFEKTFYVDMIYNAYSIIYINTVKRYNLDIYRYYIGNEGQSVSENGMKKNYKNHEDVTIELMRIVVEDKRLSDRKREYVLKRLCLPMVYVQYYINLDLLRSRKKFLIFEKRVKQYKELMKYPEFNKRVIKFHRYTNGIFIKIMPFIRKQIGRIRGIISRFKNLLKNKKGE